ncbi:MAG: hypothetical protein K1X47_04435 [Cyclobacteriaceae bacterium]|nr:hypothetical protein [Cyclobacteriaceae bacterium]
MKILSFRFLRYAWILTTALSLSSCVMVPVTGPVRKRIPYETVDFEGLVKRYMDKDRKPDPVEGIYQVSCLIVKTKRGFFSGIERDKVIMRKDNYAKVVVIKDDLSSSREFMELSLTGGIAANYPVMGEFSRISEGKGFIYRHFQQKGPELNFTFATDNLPEVFEGIRTEVIKTRKITYKLSYLKLYPRHGDLVVQQ